MAQRTWKKHAPKPLKYEMQKRKEQWKALNDPIEKQLTIPPEEQAEVVGELVSAPCYITLAEMLNLPQIYHSYLPISSSIDTVIPFEPIDECSIVSDVKKSLTKEQAQKSTLLSSFSSDSGSSADWHSDSVSVTLSQTGTETTADSTPSRESVISSESEEYSVLSNFVEIEKKVTRDRESILKHKAILKFLDAPEAEAATWRVKPTREEQELKEMTLEEQGDYLINRIAEDFCDWMRNLGGNESSSMSEETIKELFQVFMENPASRAVCILMSEKKVLYPQLSEFLRASSKSFHVALSKHLNWDTRMEKKPSKIFAFGESLPRVSRFKTPKNKTAETWLEWNKLSKAEVSFADVYEPVKDLRSTREYCKWMMDHPEHKRPQYLEDQGMFSKEATFDAGNSVFPFSFRLPTVAVKRSTFGSTILFERDRGTSNMGELFEVDVDREEFQRLVEDKLQDRNSSDPDES